MTRVLYWLGVFVLSAVVAHLSYVLFAPRQAASALMQQMQRDMGANRFHALSGGRLRRLVRYPLPEAAYGACLVDVSEASVQLEGPDLRTPWALTVYSPRGDVIYAITDRHVPAGPLEVRFEYRKVDRASGEIALPKLRGRTMVVPLSVKEALMLLEAWPWHPGQEQLLQERMKALTCSALPRETMATAPEKSWKGDSKAPVPRARPVRGKAGNAAR